MQPNSVCWFEIYVQDMARARKFYEAVLNVKLEQLPVPQGPKFNGLEMYAFPMNQNAPGAAGALAKMNGVPSGGGGTVVYLSCEDCANEAARVTANGGKVLQPKMAIGQYGFIAIFNDTEGNCVGLHSTK